MTAADIGRVISAIEHDIVALKAEVRYQDAPPTATQLRRLQTLKDEAKHYRAILVQQDQEAT